MNIVPHVGFSPIPMLDRLMQVARQNPNAVAHIQRLAQRYGPVAMAHVRQFLDHAGYRAGRAVRNWIGRHVRPRRNQFLLNVRRALGRAQQTRIRRIGADIDRVAGKRSFVRSNYAQVRRSSRGGWAVSRGGYGSRRSGFRRGRMPMRFGGRRNFPLYRAIRPELKNYDLDLGTVAISNAIELSCAPWGNINVGAAVNQRVGRKILAKSLTIAGSITSNAAPGVAAAADTVWMWVVLDRQPNGALATPADVWRVALGDKAMRNLDNGPRFKILKCTEMKIDYGQSGVFINCPFELYMKLNIPVTWQGLINGLPYTNNLLVFFGTANQNNTTLQTSYVCRVRFTDV